MSAATHVASEVIAALGLVCWALVPVPQVFKNYRSKSTDGLSVLLTLIWSLNGVLISTYAIVMRLSPSLIAQPLVFSFFLWVSFFQYWFYDHYGRKYLQPSLRTLGLVAADMLVLCALVFGLRAAQANGVSLDFFAYVTVAVGVGGLLPQYYEAYKRGRVVGLSLGMCALDAAGALFGAIAIALSDFQIATFVLYLVYFPITGFFIPLYFILEARFKRLHPDEWAAEQAEKLAAKKGEDTEEVAAKDDPKVVVAADQQV
ncbi:hypothetical protein DFJ74DRAFT_643343 [Hyaloraphidium curvatum]|nr:hypothetical protein DFJ74DRAFT_643343 [Hyaloraphidium curvatum]